MNKPIYKPNGRASEYGELAANIYTGCNHGCSYCYARKMKRRWTRSGEPFNFDTPEPRAGIVEAVGRQIEREKITGRTIFLCFSCDPYPADIDTTTTREVIQTIKESGNNVRILTKGGYRAYRDFDLLGPSDWFGVTVTEYGDEFKPPKREPRAALPLERLETLYYAKQHGISTWISLEPVIDPQQVFNAIIYGNYIDHFKIGKLNHAKIPLEVEKFGGWARFGEEAERLCRNYGRDYYIKGDLRAEMQKAAGAGMYADDGGSQPFLKPAT